MAKKKLPLHRKSETKAESAPQEQETPKPTMDHDAQKPHHHVHHDPVVYLVKRSADGVLGVAEAASDTIIGQVQYMTDNSLQVYVKAHTKPEAVELAQKIFKAKAGK